MLIPKICIKGTIDTRTTEGSKTSLGAYNTQYIKRASSSQSGKRPNSSNTNNSMFLTSTSFKKQDFLSAIESPLQMYGTDHTPNTTMFSAESLTMLDGDSLGLTATKSGEMYQRKYLHPSFSRKENSMEKKSTVKLLDVSGVLQKSEEIIKSIRTPKQIYTESFELRSPTAEDSRAQHLRKAKIKKHMAIQDKMIRSPGNKIEIPAEYYKKLTAPKKGDDKKVRKSSPEPVTPQKPNKKRIYLDNNEVKSTSNKERKVRPITPIPGLFKPNSTSTTMNTNKTTPISVGGSPSKAKRPSRLKKRDSSFHCFTNDESEERTLSIEGNSRLNTSYAQQWNAHHKQHDFYLERRSVTPSRTNKRKSEWILRTTQLKEDIDSFMSKTEDYVEFADLCQEKNADNIRNLGNTNFEEFMREKEERISYDQNEVKEVLKELKEVDKMGNLMKMGYANKRNLSGAKAANTENLHLYRYLLNKQHRAADKAMHRIYTPKLKYIGWIAEGRKIFV